MSKDVTTYTDKQIEVAEEAMAAKAEAMKAKLQTVGNRISLKDKKFTLPNGETPGDVLDVIVLGWNSQNLLYEGAYDPNDIKSPVCFAIGDNPDTLEPDASIQEPKAATCATCDDNQYGSANGGTGKGKACKNSFMVAVRLPSKPDIFTISLSPTSLKDFSQVMGACIDKLGDPVKAIIGMAFDKNVSYAKVVYPDLPQANPTWMDDYQIQQSGEIERILAIKPE